MAETWVKLQVRFRQFTDETNQSTKLVYFVAANNNFTFTEKQKKIVRQQQEGCEGTVRSPSQAAFLNLNLIQSTIVIISDN